MTVTQSDGTVSTRTAIVVIGGGGQTASSTRATASSTAIIVAGSAHGLKGTVWTAWGVGMVMVEGVAAVGLAVVL